MKMYPTPNNKWLGPKAKNMAPQSYEKRKGGNECIYESTYSFSFKINVTKPSLVRQTRVSVFNLFSIAKHQY